MRERQRQRETQRELQRERAVLHWHLLSSHREQAKTCEYFPGPVITGLSHLKSCPAGPPGEHVLGQHHRDSLEEWTGEN